MAGSALSIQGSIQSLAFGSITIGPLPVQNSGLVGEALNVTLGSGDNTIAIPTGCGFAVIVPPSANAVALKLRTNLNSGDGGLPISAANFTFYDWLGLSPTSLIINAASATSAPTYIAFG